MRIVAKTDIGNQRNENQDNYRAGRQNDGTVWALVCDGMGGTQGGKIASGVACEYMERAFCENIDNLTSPTKIKKFLYNVTDIANSAIYKKSEEDENMYGMGTTLVCTVIRNNLAQFVHVGDSRAYLYTNGCLIQLTKDHSMVQELLAQGRITIEQANCHPNKNLITRALGVSNDVVVDYGECAVKPGDMILLCTDGLTNFVSDEEITKILSRSKFDEAADKLISRALESEGLDNITVLLVAAQLTED